MPTLYILAGPPGVGKTTSAGLFIDERIEIENSDITAVALKNQGEEDYQEIAFEQLRIKAENNCKLNIDFGIELNLGCQIPHYSYARYFRRTGLFRLLPNGYPRVYKPCLAQLGGE